MDTQPTPGPWCVMQGDIGDQVFTEATPHRRICGVYGGTNVNDEAGKIGLANAYLIAAAPEMRDTLKEILDAIRLGMLTVPPELNHTFFRAMACLRKSNGMITSPFRSTPAP